ncbi:hypothetical protein DFH28DRAFT_928889 [Melampsora americana]|nr:hypothetical protein DFH28DRAFT_928889 [Melampsora americana]
MACLSDHGVNTIHSAYYRSGRFQLLYFIDYYSVTYLKKLCQTYNMHQRPVSRAGSAMSTLTIEDPPVSTQSMSPRGGLMVSRSGGPNSPSAQSMGITSRRLVTAPLRGGGNHLVRQHHYLHREDREQSSGAHSNFSNDAHYNSMRSPSLSDRFLESQLTTFTPSPTASQASDPGISTQASSHSSQTPPWTPSTLAQGATSSDTANCKELVLYLRPEH